MNRLFTIGFFLAANLISFGQVCLHSSTTYTTGGVFMTSGDFNNDGKTDLVTGNAGALYTMLGDGAGNFTTDTVTHLSYLGAMLTTDLNLDGIADIVMTNSSFNGSNIIVLLGTGLGGFHAPIPVTTNLDPWGLASNDFNSDGNPDLAVTNIGTNNLSVFLGDGAGNLGSKTDYTFGNHSPFGTTNKVLSQDLNADGHADLVLSSQDSLVVFLGDGSGTFASYSLYPGGPSGNGSFLAANDFDEDGKTDIAAADGTSGAIVVWPGTGMGTFGTAITTHLAYPMQAGNFACADFDSDGHLDLALCTQNNNRIGLLLGNGTGSFQAPIYFVDTDVPEIAIASDFNSDGKPDLAVGNQQGGANFMIFLNLTPPNLSLTSSSSTYLCATSSATLTASGATTYTWSANSGVSDPSYTTAAAVITPTANATYSVIAETNGCFDSASVSISVVHPQIPNICVVSTDSATLYRYNVVVWDKTPYYNVDSFIVYRKDVLSSSYLRIGAVSKDSLSQFVDTCFSVGGPNGGNPLFSSWTYKLAIKDTCGNISQMSPYHQTMFVQQNGSNFSWNAYTVESGQANPVTGYSFLCDNNNTGVWQVLVNTASTSCTDPNYASYPNGNWRVDAIGFSCTSTMRLSDHANTEALFNKAHSNTSKPTVSGISQLNAMEVNLYPNPNNGRFMLCAELENASVEVYSLMGELVYRSVLEKGAKTIELNQAKGSYLVHITSKNTTVVKHLVIQ